MRIYGYLQASTKEQDEQQASTELEVLVAKNGGSVSAWFYEKESRAKLKRPELFRLLDLAQEGDVLLVEQVDCISRLNRDDWGLLRSTISNKGIKIVSKDIPSSHQLIQSGDQFTEPMLSAINTTMLDMLSAIARKEYDNRRQRQAQGVQRAKKEGKYKGRKENKKLHCQIEGLLSMGKSYEDIVETLNCSKSTIAKIKKRLSATINEHPR